ncbi:Uu.00g109190.m01.CDS01 [Anthostomella pinea]|uniref:Uu.00g109190.m01.CDS01 n=1 Tax=Anthostomella pinea TaxID=933095 RepID=A0AAI8YGA3_9PEZI|nr:Uu.00g109190.m01.CDS01 [Anthostomella pinea]
MAPLLSTLRALSLLSLVVFGNAYPKSLENRQTASGSTRIGCYTDNTGNQQALSGTSYGDDALTVDKCAAFCKRYKLFGLEYGRECWCGDSVASPNTEVGDGDCCFQCSGDATETCGAGNRLDVYQNGDYSPRRPATLPAPEAPYVGCFANDGDPHPLPSKVISQDNMTAAVCASNCAGYKYFGTEYGRECYCGNASPTSQVAESECSLPCAGNDDEPCGAASRLSLYGAVGTYEYHGCHTDIASDRALTGKVLYNSGMTLQLCAGFCSEYAYFGLEYSTQCFCGATLTASSTEVAQMECGMACSGDAFQSCGDGNRVSVFHDHGKQNATAGNKAVVGAFGYSSCWVDQGEARSLTGDTYRSDNMTVESCAAFCAGFDYFGVEYTTECYCGNYLQNGAAPEADCDGTVGQRECECECFHIDVIPNKYSLGNNIVISRVELDHVRVGNRNACFTTLLWPWLGVWFCGRFWISGGRLAGYVGVVLLRRVLWERKESGVTIASC